MLRPNVFIFETGDHLPTRSLGNFPVDLRSTFSHSPMTVEKQIFVRCKFCGVHKEGLDVVFILLYIPVFKRKYEWVMGILI